MKKLWRMPLHKNFDKLINSKNADMQNINYVEVLNLLQHSFYKDLFLKKHIGLMNAGMAFSKHGEL